MEFVSYGSGSYRFDREALITAAPSPRSAGKTQVQKKRMGSLKVLGPDVSVQETAKAERAPVERLQKGQAVTVKDNVQRVVGPLATLVKSGDIDHAQSSAAERWYRDYVMGVIGARDPEGRRSGKAPDLHGSMLARTAAVGRCRSVRNGLGLCGETRLKLLLVEELSFSSIAASLFPGDVNGRKKVAAQLAFLLEQLAEHYLALDQQRR